MIQIIYVIISFILDSLLSNYTNFSLSNLGYFNTIYTIISLIIIGEYYKNTKKYLLLILIFGILFDIIYTNTPVLNIVLFFTIYLFNNIYEEYVSNNIFTLNIKVYLSIALYHILSFIILLVSNYNEYNIYILFKILFSSILSTIIYTTISYYILKKINPNPIK